MTIDQDSGDSRFSILAQLRPCGLLVVCCRVEFLFSMEDSHGKDEIPLPSVLLQLLTEGMLHLIRRLPFD